MSLCPRQRAWWSPCTPGPPCTHCCTETGSRWSPGTIAPHAPNPTGAVDSAPCPPAASGFSKGFSVQLGDLTPPTQTSQTCKTSAAWPRAEVSQLLALREALGSHQRDGLGRGGVGGGAGAEEMARPRRPWGEMWPEPSGSQGPFQWGRRLLPVDGYGPPGQPPLPGDALSPRTGTL